jgi:hypothetical protein
MIFLEDVVSRTVHSRGDDSKSFFHDLETAKQILGYRVRNQVRFIEGAIGRRTLYRAVQEIDRPSLPIRLVNAEVGHNFLTYSGCHAVCCTLHEEAPQVSLLKSVDVDTYQAFFVGVDRDLGKTSLINF